jgi:hypothetical protein
MVHMLNITVQHLAADEISVLSFSNSIYKRNAMMWDKNVQAV